MAIRVSFADLTHTGQVVAANTFPFGISMVAAYAKQELGDEIDFEVFKYPDDYANYLDHGMPQIAGFSNFSWNIRLHHEYAKRIKQANPNAITVFGGPNFPGAPDEQEAFLKRFSFIDFYFEFEGEISFVKFFEAMREVDFDLARFKRERMMVQNIRYVVDGDFVAAPLAEKIADPNIIPSPHLYGICDKFYDDILIPMIQTTRGCPYQCAFCWEGGPYFRKIKRFDQERVYKELDYIAARAGNVPDLVIVDANFGMFPEDMETAKKVKSIQQSHKQNWPKTVLVATAKNHKERTIEIVELMGDTLPPTGAVQSTDPEVLANIKRKNPPIEALNKMAAIVEKHGGQSEAEMILCLEGETKTKHFQTVFDMLDANFSFIRMYQFMMLPGTKSSSREHREKYGFINRFRVLPRCFGKYRFGDEIFPCAEVEEIVVGNNTMPREDYQACRNLHLTVEVFANDSVFFEIMKFLERYGIKRSEFIRLVHEKIVNHGGAITDLYRSFGAEEAQNLSERRRDLESFTEQPGVIERYIDGELGTNELYRHRALAVFEHLPELHKISFAAARELVSEANELDELSELYLNELMEFSLLRKVNTLNTEKSASGRFHFDFVQLLDHKFALDPRTTYCPDGIDIEIYHTEKQKGLIDGYVKQYTTSLIGLGRIILRANMNRLYRSARLLDGSSKEAVLPKEVLAKTDRLGGGATKTATSSH